MRQIGFGYLRGCLAALLLLCGCAAAPAQGAAPLAHRDAVPASRLSLDGQLRLRFEHLDDDFRRGAGGSDGLLVSRLRVAARYSLGEWTLGTELYDARAFGTDRGTPISNTFVNATDALQLHVGRSARWFAADSGFVRAGRMTLNVGSRRLIARNGFRNTINAFSGVHWRGDWRDGRTFDAFVVTPVRRRPTDAAELADNAFRFDRADGRRWLGGALARGLKLSERAELDLYGYALIETRGAKRRLFVPGLRARRAPAVGAFDVDFELALQLGSRKTVPLATDERSRVFAALLHAELGRSWRVGRGAQKGAATMFGVGLAYDYASGDDPRSDRHTRFDPLYGARRGDFGNTSLFGPLTRSNLSALGVRLSFHTPRIDARVLFKRAALAEARDAWAVAGLTDPSGAAGRRLGSMLDWRIRYWLAPRRWRVEFGGSALWFDRFAKRVPDGGNGTRSLYGFAQLTRRF